MPTLKLPMAATTHAHIAQFQEFAGDIFQVQLKMLLRAPNNLFRAEQKNLLLLRKM